MNTTLSEQSISTAPDNPNLRWPEPLRNEPVIDPFPTRILKWIIPGIIGLVMLFAIYGLLYQAANRQIIFLAENEDLAAVRANYRNEQNENKQKVLAYSVPQPQEWNIAGQASILPVPRWSPNGSYLAATIKDNGQIRAAIFPSDLSMPIILTKESQGWTAVPGNGWSYRSRYLAVLTYDNERLHVNVYDTRQRNYLSEPQIIDTRVGLHWSPHQDELIFTTYTNEMTAPSLRIVDSNGNLSNFAPEDNQLMHTDGVWSPNGQQIAYIASNNYTDTQDVLWGSLWIADREGQNPQQIISDGYVLAPFWSPRGDYLYFTRFTRDARFELYRIATNGSVSKEEYVGPGTDAVVLFPFHRNLFVQWSPNNKQMLFLGHGQATPDNYLSTKINESNNSQVSQKLPVKFSSQWSPNGRQFAGTVIDGDAVVIFVYDAKTGQRFNYTAEDSDMLVFPADGWSPDNKYVALLRHDGTNTKMAVLDPSVSDPNERSIGTAGFYLNVKAGFNWHPNNTQLIATSLEEGITTSLKTYDVRANSVGDFEPEDGQLLHADGVWSPNGRRVAYVARDTLTDTLDLDFLTGSLWIADSNAHSAQQLVADGLNFAPIWSADNRHILFTRFMTETETFELYQVDVTNHNVERLGLSTSEFADFPFDRQTLLKWSPDGRYWSLPGARINMPLILYYATTDITNVSMFPEQCNTTRPFTASWTPTNRAVLLACPSGPMFLHWIGRVRNNIEFTDGTYPSWQP